MDIALENNNVSKYWEVLKSLPPKLKIELINRLSASLLLPADGDDKSAKLSKLVGVWKDSKSAEEMAEDLRSSRTANSRMVDL